MQLITIGTKNQIVIPKEVREKINGLKPGAKVGIQKISADSIVIKTNPQDWVQQLSGSMKDAWKDIDPIAELKKMRSEWDERLRKHEKISKKK